MTKKEKSSVSIKAKAENKTTAKKNAFPEPQVIEASAKSKDFIKIQASRTEGSTSTTVRRNTAATISRTDKYAHIEGGVIPFSYGGGLGKYTSTISIRDAIILCQKAYYNFSIFRNTIDLMTDFTCSPIYFTGGNSQSLKFFKAWGDKVNLWKLQDMFFREYFRSGNVFLYKLNAQFSKDDMMIINEISAAQQEQDIPIRYIVLNPADIQSIGSASFVTPRYVKVLNDFEMQVLTNPMTEEDKELANRIKEFGQLQKDSRAAFTNQYLVFYLDPERVKAVFYKKQDYEPFSVPMGFPVLEDINWKQELKCIDMAVSRTVQQAILLVTMGNDEVGMPSRDQISNLKKIFENESVGRILVTDYTTNVKFVIPEIGQILDPKKYEVVDRDIRYGLNNVLVGEEKYANTSTKVEVFLSRLKNAREAFLNQFLIPEIKQISKRLGFKNIPTPRFTDSDFRDEANLTRIYTRLVELGALTPEEGITAIETGRLPLPEESLDSQKKFKQFHSDGLYQPLLNKPQDQSSGGSSQSPSKDGKTDKNNLSTAPNTKKPQPVKQLPGRPTGTGTPKFSAKPGKIGASENQKIDAKLVATNLVKFDKLVEDVSKELKEKFNKKRISKEQQEIVVELAETIAMNESPENWNSNIKQYIENPKISASKLEEINQLSETHNVDKKTAILLMHSKIAL